MLWIGILYVLFLYIIGKNIGIDTETWIIVLVCVLGCIGTLFLADMIMQWIGAYEVIWKWQSPLLVLD